MYGWNGSGTRSHIVRDSGNNGYTEDYDNCWPFENADGEGEEEQCKSGASDKTPPPLGTSFMQSLLDLQGFCADTQRQQRKNKNSTAQDNNNCICLLHQILIKVVVVWGSRMCGILQVTTFLKDTLFAYD